MTGKTHKTAGILTATGILLTTNIATAPLEIICFGAGCIYGALWPDIDAADYSKAKSAFVVSNFLFGALNGILRAFHIRKITSHRGITHSLFVPLITWYICHFLNTRPEFSLLFEQLYNTLNIITSLNIANSFIFFLIYSPPPIKYIFIYIYISLAFYLF